MLRFALASSLAFSLTSAFAQYAFEGHHSYKLVRNSKKEIVAYLCYDGLTRCTAGSVVGSEAELKTYLQQKIFGRKDRVTLATFDAVMAESNKVLKGHEAELAQRQKEIARLERRDPKAAALLTPLVDEIKSKIFFDQEAIARLNEGKKNSLDILAEVEETLSGAVPRSFKISHYDKFDDFQWNRCINVARDVRQLDCFHASLQFYLQDRGVQQRLITLAARTQNAKAGFPKHTDSGLAVTLLTTDAATFGKVIDRQRVMAPPVREESGSCTVTGDTGLLHESTVGCKIFGKNWRFPTIKEFKKHRSSLEEILPELEPRKLFLTSTVKGYTAQNGSYVTECWPVYYNLTYGGTVNDDNRLVRTFTNGTQPKSGGGAICVCTEDCDK